MTNVVKLIRIELRLVMREPLVLAFVFAFPIVTFLVIAGSFGARDAHSFGGVLPSKWYVSSYLRWSSPPSAW
jgi:ABC-2 type transport system permease protein